MKTRIKMVEKGSGRVLYYPQYRFWWGFWRDCRDWFGNPVWHLALKDAEKDLENRVRDYNHNKTTKIEYHYGKEL